MRKFVKDRRARKLSIGIQNLRDITSKKGHELNEPIEQWEGHNRNFIAATFCKRCKRQFLVRATLSGSPAPQVLGDLDISCRSKM
jgi:hypothetical protein